MMKPAHRQHLAARIMYRERRLRDETAPRPEREQWKPQPGELDAIMRAAAEAVKTGKA